MAKIPKDEMIRNPQGIWINTSVFREAGLKFINTGKYCHELPGSLEFIRWWNEEERRCIEGFEIGGVKIPGRYYFYLNYCPIERIDLNDDNRKKRRVDKKFLVPEFWSGDYEYYWFKHIAENGLYPEDVGDVDKYIKGLHLENKVLYTKGGKSMIIGKARRRGFSYKNASDAAYDFTFLEKKTTLIAAYDKKYLFSEIGIFTKVQAMLNHLNTHCPAFKRSRLVNKLAEGRIKSGYWEYLEDGTPIEMGKQSSIFCVSFMDNPDAARGADTQRIIVEEAGTFVNWGQAYSAMEPSIRAGDFYTGTMSVFGTGGDMEGGTIDFAEMFYNPDNYNMMPFENVWDKEIITDQSCGFFFPMYQNYEGAYDKQGNADIPKAKELLTKLREEKKIKAKSPDEYKRHCTEYAWSPEEAFQVIGNNIFPIDDLKKQLGYCKTKDELKGVCGMLKVDSTGKIIFEVDVNAIPLEYRDKRQDKSGTIQIWEQPKHTEVYGLFVAGLDPYDTDEAEHSDSLGSIFIFKRCLLGEKTSDIIVAEYTGRPASFKEYYDNCILLLEYYGIVGNCLYENNINNFKTHCENRHKLYLLSKTPTILKSAANQSAHVYGLRITGNAFSSVKKESILYVNEWLRALDSQGIPNLYSIKSIGLLQELIHHNDTGNFDRYCAFVLALIRHIELIRTPTTQSTYKKTEEFFTNFLFKRNPKSNNFF